MVGAVTASPHLEMMSSLHRRLFMCIFRFTCDKYEAAIPDQNMNITRVACTSENYSYSAVIWSNSCIIAIYSTDCCYEASLLDIVWLNG